MKNCFYLENVSDFFVEISGQEWTRNAVGGFLDSKLNKLLELDGKNEAVIYLIAIGS